MPVVYKGINSFAGLALDNLACAIVTNMVIGVYILFPFSQKFLYDKYISYTMQEKEALIKLTDKNRLTIPKEAFQDLKMSVGDHVIIRWSFNKIEVIPATIKPRVEDEQ